MRIEYLRGSRSAGGERSVPDSTRAPTVDAASRPWRRPFQATMGPAIDLPARSGDLAGQPVLDVGPQSSIGRQFGRLGTSCRTIGMPLRRDRSILEASAARGGVASQLARDRRRGTRKLPRDLSNPLTLGTQESDLFTLSQRQVAPRRLAAPTAQVAMGAYLRTPETIWPRPPVKPQHLRAASSLEHPSAIACQNGRRSDRCSTGGRPGDLIFARPIRPPSLNPSQPPIRKCCDDGLNSPSTRSNFAG